MIYVKLLSCLKAFHNKTMTLNTPKYNQQGTEMDQIFMTHTSQTTSSRLIRKFPKYLTFLTWL